MSLRFHVSGSTSIRAETEVLHVLFAGSQRWHGWARVCLPEPTDLPTRSTYNKLHPDFFFLAFAGAFFLSSSALISLATSWKLSCTLMAVLALAKNRGTSHRLLFRVASSAVTSKSSVRSHLLPTRTMGTSSLSFTRKMWSRNSSIFTKLFLSISENSKRKPLHDLM